MPRGKAFTKISILRGGSPARIIKKGAWNLFAMKVQNAQKNVKINAMKFMRLQAKLAVATMQGVISGQIASGPMPRLAPFTLLKRKAHLESDTGTPLYYTKQLHDSIGKYEDRTEGKIYVGPLDRTTRGLRRLTSKGSIKIRMISEMLEKGRPPQILRVTSRMRAYFHWLSKKTSGAIKPIGKTTYYIRYGATPPRPFVKKTLDIVTQRMKDALTRVTVEDLFDKKG